MPKLFQLITAIALAVMLVSPVSAATIINGQYADYQAGTFDDVKVTVPVDTYYERLTDYANGYSVLVPQGLKLDASLSPVVTVLTNDLVRMEIFYDNFTNTEASTADYMVYSNRFLNNTRDHTLLADDTYRENGFKIHLLNWTRRKLAHMPNDKNYYASIELAKNSNEVYTIIIKSTQPIENAGEIATSFTLVERQGTPQFNRTEAKSTTPFSAETRAVYDKFFSVSSPLRWGIFEPVAPQKFENLDALEARLDYKFPVLVRYQSFTERLPIMALNAAYERGRIVELTLQTGYDFTDNSSVIYDILDGKYDEYLEMYAKQIKYFGHPILFRLNNEMNGDWCWYSAHYYSKDAELYKAMWRYIRSVFDANGIDNVIWVWNPHDLSFPAFKWNHHMMYYPGDEYVDVVGLTGYNTGTYFPGERWREFSSIYPQVYTEYTQQFSKPFMITEFGSNSFGGNKPQWMNRMFEQIGQFDKIKVAIWWNGIDRDSQGNPGRIYLLDETEETTEAFRQGLTKFTRQ
ncbi:MAG: celH [Firmicutes bacterium]|nr:celH [Bacillota bacterium]